MRTTARDAIGLESVFGSLTAARTLLFLENYSEGYASEIADTFGLESRSQVARQLRKLETGGYLVSRLAGRTRIYGWNLRNPFVKALREMLRLALEALPESDIQKFYRRRRRPRRPGKPL